MPYSPRGVPWSPGPLLSSPLGMAAWRRAQGEDLSSLGESLSASFPDVNPAQIGKVVGQYRRLEPILEAYASDAAAKLRRQDVARDASIPESYRYVVNVHFSGPFGFGGTTRTLIIDSPGALTWGRLRAQAAAMVDRYFTDPRYESFVPESIRDSPTLEPILALRRT